MSPKTVRIRIVFEICRPRRYILKLFEPCTKCRERAPREVSFPNSSSIKDFVQLNAFYR
jgi:hypothetical protein